MEDEKLLRYGIHLMSTGNKPEAIRVFLALSASKNDSYKLQAIDALVSLLDQIKDFKLIESLCDTAIRISKSQKRVDNTAYFQIKKASTVATKVGGWKYVRKMFKLSPGWFNFATKEEENKYKSLDKKIQKTERKIDKLCSSSLKNAKLAHNNKLLGMIYLYRSPIWKNRYSDIKIDKMLRTLRFLPHCRLRDLLEYNKEDLKMVDSYDRKAIADLKTAIEIFKKVDDKDSISYCLNNLTNHYLHSYRYLRAWLTFIRLKRSIKGTKDRQLLSNFDVLKSRLFSFNRNIPNYVEEYKDFMGE